MGILNTRLQLRGAVIPSGVFSIPQIQMGMNPLPLRGVVNGSSIEITHAGKGGLEVSTTKVHARGNSKTSGGMVQSIGSKVYRAKSRKANSSKPIRSGSKKGSKKNGQKRINGRFSK